MVDEARARELAIAAFDAQQVVLGGARELNDGWFFPSVTKGPDLFTGVIVNKRTGRCLRVRAHTPLDKDPTLYDRGYQYDGYDLVVLGIGDLDQTVRIVMALHVVTVDTYYKNDRVYRVGRPLTEAEVRERLSKLPCIFSGGFIFHIDELEHAREAGWMSFKVFEYRGKD
ncbi:hypothetical protein BTO20_15975 [Mycobacterium dioxanotrophicus]|uniref:Uncharacterized protein n=1 Tax=Mycobacterium dioxanotrophicus TaxID=482462 RepID=A0A1Y0C445_9MYCO|nr:hypothetical protein [Mycobacterium dioxanotrophicus]ART69877.1 hypothetical protein BTO20_15975 [Mycobacterium dioxanotrophicus]